ncbi:uncharacterized protein [Typha angustifolia]|uniref:uncharacterized protein n=1 Tax=Typha angustifolia TaxID=59011 RepID=UPI003C2B99CD
MGQAMNKSKNGQDKASIKSSDSKTLSDIIKGRNLEGLDSFDSFYHEVHEIIQELRKRTGAIQVQLRSSVEIKKAYEENKKDGGALSKAQCEKIIKELIKVEDIHIGKAVDILALIYGAPICAFFGKKIIPGANSFSDDVVIPLATAAAALFLTKTNKL